MTRLNLEKAAPAVQHFIRTLPKDPAGFELAFGNQVLWKLVRPGQLSEAEKASRLLTRSL